jgi:ATP-dependent DNA helicase DinG
MRGELVAIDLETTGLDPMKDEIIEVGAVRMRDGEVIDEYSTMVDPKIPIPTITTNLTGITEQDVKGAPVIDDILPQIAAFTGDTPVIAHNITMDMGFLQDRHGILLNNQRIDTYDLASVLIPNAPRYNLNSLTQQVGITLENAHRALDDARATILLYWKFWQQALELPHAVLEEIVRATRHVPWDSGVVFEEALRMSKTTKSESQYDLFDFSADDEDVKSFTPATETTPVNPLEVTSVIAPGGKLTEHIPGFEYRVQQDNMATAIIEAFNAKKHLIVEAGTGTGKSIAYLVPAILWALQNQQRVIISTNTINLQDQLISKDIPVLKEALGIDFTAAVMKGRSNYISPAKLEALRRRGPNSLNELLTYCKILVWLIDNKTGDRSDINLRGFAENNIWNQLSAHEEDVYSGLDTPFQNARQQAENAQITIVNHALLVSDAKAESRVLPEYHYLIVDEAHHLEDAITRGLDLFLDRETINQQLTTLGTTEDGLLGDIVKTLRTHGDTKSLNKFEQFAEFIGEATHLMDAHLKVLYKRGYRFLDDIHEIRPNDFMTLTRITPEHRQHGSFAQLQDTWRTLDEFFDAIADAMRRINKALGKLKERQIPHIAALARSARSSADALETIRNQLHQFIREPDENTIYWMRYTQNRNSLSLCMAPLHVGPLMEQYIWNQKDSVILTSATLRTQDNFNFIQERLYAESVETLEVGSPFNYRESTLLYLPEDMPEPGDRHNYQNEVERVIISLATELQGRVMVLFTSYSHLRQTSQAITSRLALGNISVYDQSDGTSRQALLEGFKTTEKAVLLGTRSFWEGVDIPGESLSALVIARLPFGVPTDPVVASRSEAYDSPFNQYALPEAILRFRQGFGRLIRSRTDRGIVTILDKRVTTKGYGSAFLNALPDCEVRNGSLADLPRAAKEWLDLEISR